MVGALAFLLAAVLAVRETSTTILTWPNALVGLLLIVWLIPIKQYRLPVGTAVQPRAVPPRRRCIGARLHPRRRNRPTATDRRRSREATRRAHSRRVPVPGRELGYARRPGRNADRTQVALLLSELHRGFLACRRRDQAVRGRKAHPRRRGRGRRDCVTRRDCRVADAVQPVQQPRRLGAALRQGGPAMSRRCAVGAFECARRPSIRSPWAWRSPW